VEERAGYLGRGRWRMPLAAVSVEAETSWHDLERSGTVGDFRRVDLLASGPSASKHGDAETPVRHADLHIPDGHLRTVFHGIRGEAPDPNRADGSASEARDMGRDRLPLRSAPRLD